MSSSASSLQSRQEINFERYHELHSDEINTTKTILFHDYSVPKPIIDVIIELMVKPYYKSFCRIDLSFKSKDDDIFSMAKIPNKNKKYISFDSLTMGNVNNLPILETFRSGSLYGSDWGDNDQYHCTKWKLHSYINLDIKTDEEINKEIRFDVWMQDLGDESIFTSNQVGHGWPEADHPYLCPGGKFKVSCVDYTHPKSLEFADKYANRFKTECKSMIIFVVTRKSDDMDESQETKEYFGWNDCMRLAQKYDASLFEMSTDNDNSCLFVYNQILIEYIHAFCLD